MIRFLVHIVSLDVPTLHVVSSAIPPTVPHGDVRYRRLCSLSKIYHPASLPKAYSKLQPVRIV
jgi:hypothetical protein